MCNAIDWHPIRGVTLPVPYTVWDGLQVPIPSPATATYGSPKQGCPSPESGVCDADVVVEGPQMGAVALEVLVGSSVLQDAGDGAQGAALVGQQAGAGGELQHVKAVRGHDGRVHVAIVQQVSHNLRGQVAEAAL